MTALPTPRQLAYQDWEFGLFLHFGIRTFYEGYVDWDGQPMSAARSAPSALDCDQWIRTAKAAGMRYAVVTAKRHDGFANWPTRWTAFSVASSPWRGPSATLPRCPRGGYVSVSCVQQARSACAGSMSMGRAASEGLLVVSSDRRAVMSGREGEPLSSLSCLSSSCAES